jgi:hypothetical protein
VSASYALTAGSEIELLTTTNARGKGAINLTGNEFAQQITGNAGNNVIDGKGGADLLTGGAGKDVFVLGGGAADTITDYAKGDVVDLSQVLAVAGGTSVVSGGFVRVTTSGLVQVDANGGGDQWTTLAHINGNGAVTVRYLSGGAQATVSVGRVAETMLAASVAAAGLEAMPAPGHGGSADHGQAAAGPAQSVEAFASEPTHFALAGAIALPAMAERASGSAAAEPVRHVTLVERIEFEAAPAAPDHGATPLLEATDLAAAPIALAATEAAMPSAAMLGQILADALGTGDAVLLADTLPGGDAPPADMGTFAVVMPLAGLEILAFHADAVATV